MAGPTKEELFAAADAADRAGDEEAARELMAAYANYAEPVTTVDVPASDLPMTREQSAGNAGDVARFISSSAARGVTGLANFAALPDELINRFAPKEVSSFLGSDRIAGAAEGIRGIPEAISETAFGRKPQNKAEQLADALIQGVAGGSLAGVPSGARAVVSSGVLGGIGSVAGAGTDQALEDYPAGVRIPASLAASIAATLLGHTVGSAGAALVESPTQNVKKILEGSIPETRLGENFPDQLRDSAALAKEAGAAGVPLNIPDALPGERGRLQDIYLALLAKSGGDKSAANIQEQTTGLSRLADDLKDAVGGKVQPQITNDNRMQDAATGVLADQQKALTSGFTDNVNQGKAATLEGAVNDARLTEGQLVEARAAEARAQAEAEAIRLRTRGDRYNAEVEIAKDRDARQAINDKTAVGQDVAARAKDPNAPQIAGLAHDANEIAKGAPVKLGSPFVVEPKPLGEALHPFVPKAEAIVDAKEVAAASRRATTEGEHADNLARLNGLDKMTPEQLAEARLELQSRIYNARGNEAVVEDLQHILGRLRPDMDTHELHNMITSLKADLPSQKAINGRPADIGENTIVGGAISSVLKGLRNKMTPAYEAADAAYAAGKAERNALARDTQIGQLAQRGGSTVDQQARHGAIYRLLDDHESPSVPADAKVRVKTLTALAEKDPDGTADAIASWLDGKISKAFAPENGAPSSQSANRLTKDVIGDKSGLFTDAKVGGTHEILDVMATARKLSPDQRRALHYGLDKLREYANAAARTPNRISQMGPKEFEAMAGNTGFWETLGLVGVAPGPRFLRLIRPKVTAKTYEKLDELFSNPDKVEDLIRLGKKPKITEAQRLMLAGGIGWLASQNVAQLPEDNQDQ